MNEEIKMKTKDGRFCSHLNLDNQGIRLDSFTIVWPGNPIDGKTIFRQVTTPKNKASGTWGKGKVVYFLEGEKTPEFDTPHQFEEHYKTKQDPVSKIEPKVKVKPNAKKKKS